MSWKNGEAHRARTQGNHRIQVRWATLAAGGFGAGSVGGAAALADGNQARAAAVFATTSVLTMGWGAGQAAVNKVLDRRDRRAALQGRAANIDSEMKALGNRPPAPERRSGLGRSGLRDRAPDRRSGPSQRPGGGGRAQ